MSFSDKYVQASIITLQEGHTLDTWLTENEGEDVPVPDHLESTIDKIIKFDMHGVLN